MKSETVAMKQEEENLYGTEGIYRNSNSILGEFTLNYISDANWDYISFSPHMFHMETFQAYTAKNVGYSHDGFSLWTLLLNE